MERRITGFHRDEEGDWVAVLDCGHQLHVRHDPPWQVRPWVLEEESRQARVGSLLSCSVCATDRYQDARIQGLCHDGAREVIREKNRDR